MYSRFFYIFSEKMYEEWYDFFIIFFNKGTFEFLEKKVLYL